MKMIGVCGSGCSGSSAAFDLIREYEGVKTFVSGRECEFTLPYDNGGLLDLEFALMKEPCKHLKGDYAICRFNKLTNYLERSYNRETGNKFSELTREYLDSIIQVKYGALRADDHINTAAQRFMYKALRTMEFKLSKALDKTVHLIKRDERYICACPENFEDKTKAYVNGILQVAGADEQCTMLLDQPFPPNNPESVFHFFDDPYALIIDRDPRDIYLYAKRVRKIPDSEFVPHDTAEQFVKYFRAVSIWRGKENSNRILRIAFEDLIYNYEETVDRIEKFFHLGKHINKGKWFQPEVSIRNTQMFNAFPEDREDIAYIEKELKEYLFPFEKYSYEVKRDSIISNEVFQKK